MSSPHRFSFSFQLISAGVHTLLIASLLVLGRETMNVPRGVKLRGEASLIEMDVKSSSHLKVKFLSPRANREDVLMKMPSQPKRMNAKNEKSRSLDRVSQTPETQDTKPRGESAENFGTQQGSVSAGQVGEKNGLEASVKERYLYELRTLIEGRKIYPRFARSLRETGRVMVRFQVLRDGQIEGIELASGSSFQRLNQAAIELIKGIGKYRPIPGELVADKLTLELPIEYILN